MSLKDLSHLPVPGRVVGQVPDPQPFYAPLLAEAWADTLDDGKLDMAFPEARVRHSWAGSCARKIGYMLTNTEETNPIDIADRWRFGLGTIVHERWQEVLQKAFPTAEIEKRVWIEECKSAGHIDAFIPATPTPGTTLSSDRDSGDVLDLVRSEAVRLRGTREGQQGTGTGLGTPSGLRGDGGPDPRGSASGSSLPGEGLRQPRSSGASDLGGEQSAGRGSEDALPEGSPLRARESGQTDRPGSDKQGVSGVRPDQEPGMAGSTAIELKTIGGFGMKMLVGARGAAEGPRSSAFLQGALNGLASSADKVVIVYLSLENLSQREAEKLTANPKPWQKFAAEWSYEAEDFLPAAIKEVNRLKRIIEIVDEGGLPPRSIPIEIPAGARIFDPMKGSWQVQDKDGMITDAGSWWGCQYCSFRDCCDEDIRRS